jgi:hypothetical protein
MTRKGDEGQTYSREIKRHNRKNNTRIEFLREREIVRQTFEPESRE